MKMSKTGTPGESPPDGHASDQGHVTPIPEIDADALAARLKLLIGDHSVAFFARKSGIADSVLRTYLNDGRMPPLDKALAIATAGGVTLDWLATGRGRRVTAQVLTASGNAGDGHGPQTPTLDPVVLEGILKAVLEAQGDRATPEHLAALGVDLYQRAMILDQPE